MTVFVLWALCAASYVIMALRVVTRGLQPSDPPPVIPCPAGLQNVKGDAPMLAMPCIGLPRFGDSPMRPTILIIILLSFSLAAHTMAMTTEVIVLLITTVIGAVVQLSKPQPQPQPLQKATPDVGV
ncbi:hypothetical protein ACFXJ8_39135 [Nonomuraea sp. NPDC059194]|uniref:hypothetical protein n=1 Tax=Nonomuraea sp. NPDC059194 TaxID=3346764 RepID=UPI0036A452E6